MKKIILLSAFWFLIKVNLLATTHSVISSNFAFAPTSLNIVSGDIVSFSNFAGFHFVSWETAPTTLPTNSATLSATPIEYIFTTAGTYTYACGVHPFMLGTITVSQALPIKLYTFSVEPNNEGAKISWTTSSESNVSEFILERSTENLQFEPISKINAKGNSNENSNYAFNDNKTKNGLNFYRLKSVDIDKSFEYSAIIVINIITESEIRLYPNPTFDVLILSWNQHNSHFANFQIFDTKGNIYFYDKIGKNNNHGSNLVDINVAKFVPGKYFAVINFENGFKKALPFVVNR
jgi:plastocyanin